jgi:hypothetical protein
MQSRRACLTACLMLFAHTALAGAFGEHKIIGDRASIASLNELSHQQFKLPVLQNDSGVLVIEFAPGKMLTYGELSALAGDHSLNITDLERRLRSAESNLYEVLDVQHRAMHEGHYAASNMAVLGVDFDYLPLAINNFSHFYEFGKTLDEHLQAFSFEILEDILLGRERPVERSNALAKYAMLHAAAMILAERSVHLPERQRTAMLQRALVINAFADHFLQDAFAPGHLVLKRTAFGSLTTDLQLHDYYNRAGLMVTNLRGDVWRAFGDDWMFEAKGGERNVELAIEACRQSLREVLMAAAGTASIVARLQAATQETIGDALLESFSALQIVPLPLGTLYSLANVSDSMSADEKRLLINSLDHRGPVVSRLGIAVIGGFNWRFAGDRLANIRGGMAMRGIGFDSRYQRGSSWHNVAIVAERKIGPAPVTLLMLEYQNVSNHFNGLRSYLPFDLTLSIGRELMAGGSWLVRPGLLVNYLPVEGRPESLLSDLDPKFRFSFDLMKSQLSLRSGVHFGIDLSMNPIIDLVLLEPED